MTRPKVKPANILKITDKGFEKIPSLYPDKNDLPIESPEKYGDNWEDELTNEETKIVIKYLDNIQSISKSLFSIKIGKQLITSSNLKKGNNNLFTIHTPKNSLIRAIKSNIFDDLLIGNFAKVIVPSNHRINYRNILKIPSKYIDNIGIKDLRELKDFLWVYRNSYDSKYVQLKSDITDKSRDIILSKLSGNSKLLGNLKKIYQKI